MNEEEDYYDEEDKQEGMILSIGEDGKAEIHNPDDWVEVKEEEMKLIQGFLKENKDLFKKYLKKHKPQS